MASQSHVARGARVAVADDRAVLATSGHLTERDRYLVRMVGEHRVLTTDQLCALGFGNVITARHRLGVLVTIGVLRRFRPRRDVGSAPWHYLLGPVGAALLGAEDRDECKWLPQVRADRQLALERSQRLAHMTGVNWFFTSLAHHARTDGGGELRAWLNETDAADYYKYRFWYRDSDGSLPQPDGLGTWAEHGREVTFLLEARAYTIPRWHWSARSQCPRHKTRRRLALALGWARIRARQSPIRARAPLICLTRSLGSRTGAWGSCPYGHAGSISGALSPTSGDDR